MAFQCKLDYIIYWILYLGLYNDLILLQTYGYKINISDKILIKSNGLRMLLYSTHI